MKTEVIIAIISAIPALTTAVVSVALNNRVIEVKLAALQQQFDRMQDKLDAHNNFMERIARLEQAVKDDH